MHTSSVTLLLVAVIVVGLAPFAFLAAWLGTRTGKASQSRMLPMVLAVVALAAFGGGGLALLRGAPLPASAQAGHEEHEGGSGAAAAPGPMSMAGSGGSATGVPEPPSRLAGVPATELVTGDEARRQLEQLHGLEVPVEAAAIARYAGPKGRAEVWASTAGSSKEARKVVSEMADKIAEGKSPFAVPRPLPGERYAWTTQGMGQMHAFFARGSSAWWLSADAAIWDRALDELLDATD